MSSMVATAHIKDLHGKLQPQLLNFGSQEELDSEIKWCNIFRWIPQKKRNLPISELKRTSKEDSKTSTVSFFQNFYDAWKHCQVHKIRVGVATKIDKQKGWYKALSRRNVSQHGVQVSENYIFYIFLLPSRETLWKISRWVEKLYKKSSFVSFIYRGRFKNQPIITVGGLPKLAVCHGYQNFGDQECAWYYRRSSAALISGLGLLCRSAAEQTSHGTWDPEWETHTFWFRWRGRQRWGVWTEGISGVQLGDVFDFLPRKPIGVTLPETIISAKSHLKIMGFDLGVGIS